MYTVTSLLADYILLADLDVRLPAQIKSANQVELA